MLRYRIGLFLAAACLAGGTSLSSNGEEIRFNRDIRPILSENCFQCHGPDKATRKAKLRLDQREAALESGALTAGTNGVSPLVRHLFATDPEEIMPPPASHKTLKPQEKELLRRWVEGGAPYEAHWAYLPIERPPLPPALDGRPWRHPIDAFIRARLYKEGLTPSPEADRRTLLRRLSLDLVGLPPSVAELDAFLRDTSRRAYEKQVERLLASPHFGERMAVPWLDAVRFTDTVGYHGDQNQRIFPYRDYVIDAFNANKPFDQFTVEQIAGDLLPNPTLEQRVATGFNRLNMMTREGGAQPKEYLAKYQADRVRTVANTWLGATMACCECHDHKYDPFTMRDFYSMAAYFGDVMQWGVYQDYNYTPNPDLAGWSNDHPFPPEIEVESPYLIRRIRQLIDREQEIFEDASAILRTNAPARDAFRLWRNELSEFLTANPDGWRVAQVVSVERKDGTNFVSNPDILPSEDGSLRFLGTNATTDRVVTSLTAGWVASIRLEILPEPGARSGFRGGRSSGSLQPSMQWVKSATGETTSVAMVYADADAKEPRYANGEDILGIMGGWRTRPDRARDRQVGTWTLARPVHVEEGDRWVIQIPNNPVARLRVSTSPVVADRTRWAGMMADLRNGMGRGRGLWEKVAHTAYHRSTGWNEGILRRLRALDAEIRECRGGRAWTQVTLSTNALVTRVLPRGNWMDESGPVVEPSTPHFLPPHQPAVHARNAEHRDLRTGLGDADPARAVRSGDRRELAAWLVSRDNPMTARHFANRLWFQFFGAGISARIEDLGLQGEWPTHPELLDWLAAEFMEASVEIGDARNVPEPHPWDIKHLVRLIVMSETYRQDSTPSERAEELDPANRLLSHQSPRRLDAEFIRDQALGAAGLLDPEIGGPSAFPYQPSGYYANLQFPDREYRASPGERQYRRGVYAHWQRTFLHPMLANFDAQSREECVAARLVSNTPQQALTLLNDPTFVEAARVLAEVAVRSSRRDEDRLNQMFLRVLGRPGSASERDSLLALLATLRQTYAADPKSAAQFLSNGQAPAATEIPRPELAAWSNIARVVLNLHETLTRY
ncbi:MAG: PSD1 domain-containing protein [Verrucomicrobiales bacterium]|nr:PSD1 domain-containing protein [Verrucomicrobiales bacterium]